MRDVLRTDNHDRECIGDDPKEVLLQVHGAGRKIYHEVIELAPVHIDEKLSKQRVQQRRRHRHRLVFADQETNRHHAQPPAFHRLEPHRTIDSSEQPAVESTRLLQIEHQWNVGAVDVGIEQAYARAAIEERKREVQADGRLPDTTLAAHNREFDCHRPDRRLGESADAEALQSA